MPPSPAAPDLVVIGLGYVGLSLAQEACRSGLRVTGLDTGLAVVTGLAAGRSHVDDLSDEDVRAMQAAGFRVTTDPTCIAAAANVVICVPTPLAEDGGPDLRPVLEAAGTVAEHVTPGSLVVLESTTCPGTTDELLRPRIEGNGLKVGVDVFLAFSPERIDPGNDRYGFRNTPKVVGGVTQVCTERAAAFCSRVVDVVVPARSTREAEMAKLLENTYRHVNMALVDPNHLSHTVRTALGHPFRFVELASKINHGMPGYVVQRIQGMLNDAAKPVRGSRVLLLGVTYKADVSDLRESPAVPIARKLTAAGAAVCFHDPYVADWTAPGLDVEAVADLEVAVMKADITVLLQSHGGYDLELLGRLAQLMLDTRGTMTDRPTVERL